MLPNTILKDNASVIFFPVLLEFLPGWNLKDCVVSLLALFRSEGLTWSSDSHPKKILTKASNLED